MTAFIPRAYQERVIDYIYDHPRCAIWAGMGLGKTVSTLTALSNLLKYVEEGPALVLAPKRVACTTWPDEAKKWEHLRHLRVCCMVGSAKEFYKACETIADIYCVNYERIPDLVNKFGRDWPFKIIVADESTRLKSFRLRQGSQRARELGRVAHLYADRFIELTGTPAPNGYEDLWGQIWFIDKGARLGGSMQAYHDRYFRPVRVGANAFAVKYELLPHADEMVKAKLSEVALTINTEDWFPVEKPIVSDVVVRLPHKAMDAYKQMEQELYLELESGAEIESPNAAAKVNRCLQIAGGAIYTEEAKKAGHKTCAPKKAIETINGINCLNLSAFYYETIHSEKLDALESIVTEAAGAPILVSYQFKHECARILKSFPQAKKLDADPKTIRDWNAGKIPMLLAHPASCGHGLNLQDGGNILVFFSRGWNLEEHEQIIERIGPTRQKQAGHPRAVYIYNIVAEKTLDEAVAERLASKRSLQDILLEKANERC